jgi:hypothetical protein
MLSYFCIICYTSGDLPSSGITFTPFLANNLRGQVFDL